MWRTCVYWLPIAHALHSINQIQLQLYAEAAVANFVPFLKVLYSADVVSDSAIICEWPAPQRCSVRVLIRHAQSGTKRVTSRRARASSWLPLRRSSR